MAAPLHFAHTMAPSSQEPFSTRPYVVPLPLLGHPLPTSARYAASPTPFGFLFPSPHPDLLRQSLSSPSHFLAKSPSTPDLMSL